MKLDFRFMVFYRILMAEVVLKRAKSEVCVRAYPLFDASRQSESRCLFVRYQPTQPLLKGDFDSYHEKHNSTKTLPTVFIAHTCCL